MLKTESLFYSSLWQHSHCFQWEKVLDLEKQSLGIQHSTFFFSCFTIFNSKLIFKLSISGPLAPHLEKCLCVLLKRVKKEEKARHCCLMKQYVVSRLVYSFSVQAWSTGLGSDCQPRSAGSKNHSLKSALSLYLPNRNNLCYQMSWHGQIFICLLGGNGFRATVMVFWVWCESYTADSIDIRVLNDVLI